MTLDDDTVVSFAEKPVVETGWINGGFFFLSPKAGALIEGDETIWEHGPMATLTRTGEMRAIRHDGFWRPMDTLRDKMFLEEQWKSGQAKWKNW